MAWIPNRAVCVRRPPASVFIEIFVTNDVIANVAGRNGVVLTLEANAAPVIECIEAVGLGDFMLKRSSARETGLLARADAHCWPVAGCVAFTFADDNNGSVAIWIYVEAIFTWLLNGKSHVWRIDLVRFAVKQLSDSQIHRSLVKLQLDSIIGDVGKSDACFITHAENAAAEVQFGVRRLIGPDIVRSCEGTIHRAGDPVISAMRLNGHRAGLVLQTSDSSRRIVLSGLIVVCPGNGGCQS
jgi:hypothetical protein